MALEFVCPCGCALSVSENDAGLPVGCPMCFGDVTAPGDPLRPWNRHERGTVLSSAVGGAPPANEPENPLAFVDPGEMARKRDQAVREREAGTASGGGGSIESGVFNSGMAGGALAMLIAVVWFVVGLAADVIFFYPPILFVIGLVAFFKGMLEGPSSGA